MKLEGWIDIAEAYKRTPQQLRAWRNKGAPFQKVGKLVVVETTQLDQWIEETNPTGKRRGSVTKMAAQGARMPGVTIMPGSDDDDEPGEEVVSLGKIAREIEENRLLKIKLEVSKASRADRLASLDVATREEMEAAYSKGLKQIKRWIEGFVTSTNARNKKMTAAEVEEINVDMINLFNRIADYGLAKRK